MNPNDLQAALLDSLDQLAQLRPVDLPDDEATARRELRVWQSARLARTHAALLRHERFAPAARFFLDELYGAHDHRQRDRDVARIVPKLVKLLPDRAVRTLIDALHLDALSESLDRDVVACLRAAGLVDAQGHFKHVDDAAYATAYAAAARTDDRLRQIALVDQVGHSLDRVSRLPLIATALRMMRGPAESAGLGDLHRFLSGGFTAFRALGGADEFLRCIVSGETAVMQRLLAAPAVVDFSASYVIAAG